MEAVGQLTGGIAHDFNNMLAVVIGSLNLLKRRLRRGETDNMRFIDGALDGAERAATLTHRLLAFSRQQPLAPQSIDPNKLISGMSEMLRRTLGEQIAVETVFAGGLWRTHVDPGQLENAIVNLAVNSRDAMPDGGKLTIETANASLDEAYAAQHVDVPAGQYVLLAVSDTGQGMPADVVAKAFEPFFTTKELGKGTGLGLSQVLGFVKQSGGHVKIYSEPHHGTTIKIYLPRFFGVVDELVPIVPTEPAALGQRDEVVLVVEDEERMLQVSCDAFRELGYPAGRGPSVRPPRT
jgi:signal transduction histidine kinase